MFDSYSFAPVAPCRHGSADDDPPVSHKQVSTIHIPAEPLNSTSISNKPSSIETSRNNPCLRPPNTESPDLILSSVEIDGEPRTASDIDEEEEEEEEEEDHVAAAIMDIRRQRRQQHTCFQSNLNNSSRIRKLAKDMSSSQELPSSSSCISLEPPPLLPRDDDPDAKRDSDRGDRPISPDPNEADEAMDDEGFDDGDPFDDPNWTETTLALWKVKAKSDLRRRGYYEHAGSSQSLLKCPRVVKSRPRMRRRRQEPPLPNELQPPIETITSTSNDGTAS